MSTTETLGAGNVTVLVVPDEQTMGTETAQRVSDQVTAAVREGFRPVLWLMAAPSAFPFYGAFVEACRRDSSLRETVRDIAFYQFDDYPVGRDDARFPVTFRALLEEHLYRPLEEVCGPLTAIHPLELTGTVKDPEIARDYARELADLLADDSVRVIQVKGIGMDGHWGFHGAETPLHAEPAIIEVPMGPQNIRQQRIDWPELFPTDADVPGTAYSATVSLFMQADCIIDNVPQATKQYAVLACYGTDEVRNEVPSSALKDHRNAVAVLTRAAAEALLRYRSSGSSTLLPATLERLERLWDDPDNTDQAAANRDTMLTVLRALGMIG